MTPPIPSRLQACACGWRMPAKIAVAVNVPTSEPLAMRGDPTIKVTFDCPDCGKPFEASFATESVTTEQRIAS